MSKTVFLTYYDKIDEQKVKMFIAVCIQVIQQHKPASLYFLISSEGGSVDAGITLYNVLRALPQEITMHNIGRVDSIANVVFLAGARRYASPHSTFVLHGIRAKFDPSREFTPSQLDECVAAFKNEEKKVAAIIQERTDFGEQEVLKFFQQGESVMPALAKAKGIVTDIMEPKIPEGSPIVPITCP